MANQNDVRAELTALAQKYGISGEALEQSIANAQAEQAKTRLQPKITVNKTGVDVHADWSGVDVFPESGKGNYKLSQTPGMFLRTGKKGPHGGEISVAFTVIEKRPDES